MALVVPAIAEIVLLNYIVNKVAPGNPVLHLYTNSPTLADALTTATITEATQAGYAPITLASAGWTTTNVGNVVTAVYSEVTFTFTTSATLMGYWVSTTAGALLWAEAFSGSFALPVSGGTVSIAPRITLD